MTDGTPTALARPDRAARSGYGFFNAGTLTIRNGVIAAQLDGCGAVSSEATARTLTLENVQNVDNASPGVAQMNSLPEAASLPAPTPTTHAPRIPARETSANRRRRGSSVRV